MRRPTVKWPVLALALPLLGGLACGPSNGLDLATVRGTVTYKGEPVRAGNVTFFPDDSKGTVGPPATGTINDGSFTLSSESASDGALVGTHKVSVLGYDPEPVSSAGALPDPQADPRAFLAAKTQRRRPPRKGDGPTYRGRDGKTYPLVVPERFRNPDQSGLIAKVDRGRNNFRITIDDDSARIEK